MATLSEQVGVHCNPPGASSDRYYPQRGSPASRARFTGMQCQQVGGQGSDLSALALLQTPQGPWGAAPLPELSGGVQPTVLIILLACPAGIVGSTCFQPSYLLVTTWQRSTEIAHVTLDNSSACPEHQCPNSRMARIGRIL